MNNNNNNSLNLETLDADARQAVLTAYLDGELSAEDARRVTAWLDEHPDALRDIEHQRRLWDLLETYDDEPVSDRFADGVFEAVEIRGTQRAPVLPMAWYRRPLVAAAAGMLLALGATFGAQALTGGSDDSDHSTGDHTVVASEDLSTLQAVPADLLMDSAALDFLATLDDEHFDAFVEGAYDEEGTG